MAVKFSNNVSTTLASSINSSQTSITVTDASALPALGAGDYTYVTFDTDTNSPTREVVKVTAVSGNTLTVVRGQDGTAASAFAAGTKVELRLTAALLNAVSAEASATDWSTVQNKPDPTVFLSGDVTGQGTLTDLGDVTISVTVVDDSHNHTVANVDGLQTALDAKAPLTGTGTSGTWPIAISGNAATATKLATSRTISLTGDVTGSVSFDGSGNVSLTATIADDSHNHVISNVDGLQTALDGKVPLSGASYIQSTGYSTSWGVTNGSSTGGFNALMGTSTSATWLLSGTSGGVFRAGIQSLDSNGSLRIYVGSNYLTFDGTTIGSANLSGNATTATTLQTARTISLTGDVTGSASFDGSANASITATIADDSHTHDGRYYTEAESDARFLRSDTSDTLNGALTIESTGRALLITGSATLNGSDASIYLGNSPSDYGFDITYEGTGSGNTNAFVITSTNLGTPKELLRANQDGIVNLPQSGAKVAGNTIFHDGYHPNADKWTTARTLSLTGAVTGSASIDGSGNVSLATTATSDPTLTLSGDASGSATFTNLGNATLTVTVADDSHTHDGRYYTESEIDTRMEYTLYSPQSAGGDLNSLAHYGWYTWGSTLPTNAPSAYGLLLNGADANREQQLVQTYGGSTNTVSLYGRRKTSGIWDTVWTQYFSDHYHPNADKWTTARTLSLTGAVTGSASIDGSGNVSLATTATSDPTLTLNGDVSGSATFTNLGNATLTVTVADDSHNHIISNVDGLQTALDGKLNLTGGTLDAGTSTTLTILCDDTGASTVELYGNSQGTGRVYVGQSTSYGGGIEYNGDNSPSTTGAGADYITLWRRDNGVDSWTARNSYGNNNWEFRGNLYANTSQRVFADDYHPNADALTTARTINGVAFDGTANITVADSTKLPLTGGTLTGALAWSGGTNINDYNGSYGSLQITGGNGSFDGVVFPNYTSTPTVMFDNAGGGLYYQGSGVWGWYYSRSAGTLHVGSSSNNTVLHAGNYTSYSPSLTGSGASGTWGISVTGNAATATTFATARTIALSGAATGTATSFNGSANITIPVTALNASNLSAGAVPDARLSGTYTNLSIRTDGGNTHFTTPNSGSSSTNDRTVFGLAQYKSDSSGAVGAIVFYAPNTNSSIMHRMRIEGMIYSGGPTVCAIVQGYRTTGGWSNTSKVNLGITDIQVRWGVDPSGKNCLILGDVGTTWSYPMMCITHAMFSHSGSSDAYCTGWTVGLVTSFTGFTRITSTLPNSNINTGISGNAATAGGLAVHNTQGTQNSANQIVRTQANGYTMLGWINTTSGDNGTTAISRIYASNDAYIRYYTPANFKSALSLLDTSNYNSYSPTLTGTGASGSWGISVTGSSASCTGNSATATTLATARTINGTSFNGSANITTSSWGTARTLTIGSTGKSVNGSGNVSWSLAEIGALSAGIIQQGGKTYVTHDFNSYPALYDVTFVNPTGSTNLPTGMGAVMSYRFIMGAGDTTTRGFDLVGASEGSGNLYIRERAIGTWSRVLHSNNFNTYSPTLTGGGASGSWGINVTGESRSVNLGGTGHTITSSSWAGGGGYHGYTYSGGNFRFGFSSTSGVVDVYADGNFYATDSSHLVLHAGNYTSYSPSLTGSGASGTWGINITGGAGSANVASTLSNNATITGLNFGGVLALTGSGATTGNSTGARLSESYGALWNMSNSATWHHQVINGSMLCGFTAGGTNHGSGNILATGNITAYYSDERLKTKLGNIENALAKICALDGFRYVNNELAMSFGFEKPDPQLGLSAQQVKEIAPEIVSLAPFDMMGKGDGKLYSRSGEHYMTVDYARLMPIVVEAIKQLSAELAEIKSKLT